MVIKKNIQEKKQNYVSNLTLDPDNILVNIFVPLPIPTTTNQRKKY